MIRITTAALIVLLFVTTSILTPAMAQNSPATQPAPATQPYSPAILPGNGLSQHPFLYAGEWDHDKPIQSIFIVRDGKVAWRYTIPTNEANGTLNEFSDVTMLSNGNVVFARKTGAGMVNPAKKLVWNYD